MEQRRPPQLDMTVNGEFVSPPTTPIASRILLWAIIIAILTGALTIAALALWVALTVLPVAIAAGVIAWGVYRYKLWRTGQSLPRQTSLRRF